MGSSSTDRYARRPKISSTLAGSKPSMGVASTPRFSCSQQGRANADVGFWRGVLIVHPAPRGG